MAVDVDLLRTVPLFSGMTDRAIAAVADLAEESAFAAGDVLVSEGDPGDAFFILIDGTADVSQGGRQLASLGPGSTLGEISLLDGRPRTATVTCTAPIRAAVIRRSGFERLMDGFPAVRLGVVMNLTERVRRDMDTATA
jgi:CRP/FNR family cyclic AMP-dependent transcriptional regulator